MPKGYNKDGTKGGFKKGHKPTKGSLGKIPWNKGKKASNELREKIRLAHIGLYPSEETRKKLCLAQSRENNPQWKGGIQKHSQGYIQINDNTHPFRSKRNLILQHRIVMENYIGRYLTMEEEVHHINSIPHDNRIENLILFSSSAGHTRFHRGERFTKNDDIIFDGRKL